MNFQWVPSAIYSELPADAVVAGHDADGSKIYVGRAFYEGDNIPVKVCPAHQSAYLAYAGREVSVSNYEVLVGFGFTWVSSGGGQVPGSAVATGTQSDGEPLYVGRAHFQGTLTPGKVQTSHSCLYLPFGGVEHSVTEYEVLVQQAYWVHSSTAVPHAAIGGVDVNGTTLYVGRAFHEGDHLPGKVPAGMGTIYVSHGGQEVVQYEFEILCGGNLSWVPSGHGAVPPNAVRGGQTASGETLYIGRTPLEGSLTPGKIHPSNGCLYVPFGGAEVSFPTYEVLVEN